ncbi:TMEM165/GDT1 family protein [Alkaliphilus transvaalensis]|uniref:TMEM165/GDT1 family protein n=1 Tax=Alkaliphilus transvaalensis TaxID=114628 RepID=UPI000685EFC2|nr:TMEM165/GDT1 family protein [Alkaliphilus transvaalensis]
MFSELINAFFFIFMAEMGDKTQILAMAFATKYSLHKVLLGVALGSFLNHGLAVLLGTYLTHLIPLDNIRLLSAFAFVVFGLWTLKLEEDEGEEASKNKFGPILTVALAFFIGELGDKTQLTAITLSTQANYPQFILTGTVLGMVFTSGMGVYVGSKLGKKIPELALKLISASIFIIFGIIALIESVPSQFMTIPNITLFSILMVMAIVYRLRKVMNRSLEETSFKKVAGELYLNTQRIQQSLQTVCTLDTECEACRRGNCTIRCLQEQLAKAQVTEKFLVEEEWDIPLCKGNQYDPKNLRESLMETLNTCLECQYHQKNCVGNQTRVTLEKLYFGETIPFDGSKKDYFLQIKERDPQFYREFIAQKENNNLK